MHSNNTLDKASCKGVNAIITAGAVQILDYTGSEAISSLVTESEPEKVKEHAQADAQANEEGLYHAAGYENSSESGDASSRGSSPNSEIISTSSSSSTSPTLDLNSLGSTDTIVSDQLNTGSSPSASFTSGTQSNELFTGSLDVTLGQLADNWAALGTELVNENANAAADESKGDTYAFSVTNSVAISSSDWSNGSESSSASTPSGTGTGSRNSPLQQPCTDVGRSPDALAKPVSDSAAGTGGKGALLPERVPASAPSTFVVSASSASTVQSGEGPLDITALATGKVNLDDSENDAPERVGLGSGLDTAGILRNGNWSNGSDCDGSDDNGSGDDGLPQMGVIATESQLKLGASSAGQEVRKQDEEVGEGVHQDGEHADEGVKKSESAKVGVFAEVKAEDKTSKANTTPSTPSGSITPSSNVGAKTSKDHVDCECTDTDLLGKLLGSGSVGAPTHANVDEQVHADEQKGKDHIPDGLPGPASSSSSPTSITKSGNVNSGTTVNTGAQAAEWTQNGGDSDHSDPSKANSMLGLDDKQNKIVTADGDVKLKAVASVDVDSTGQSQGQWPDATGASNDSAKNSGRIRVESTLSLSASADAHAL